MKNIIPAILSLLDKLVPMKGYRNIIFFGLTVVSYTLGHLKVIPAEYADAATAGLLALTGYYAGAHKQ